jgi:hypothetical protein
VFPTWIPSSAPSGTLAGLPYTWPATTEYYSTNLWGCDIRTLYNLKKSDAEGFFDIVDQLDLRVGTSVFSFEELPDVLALVKQGKLPQPNAVIEIAGSS